MPAEGRLWPSNTNGEQLSKHLKGQLGPRVGDVTFFNHGGQLGPCVGDVTFFNHGGQLGTCVGDVTFFNQKEVIWGPASVT